MSAALQLAGCDVDCLKNPITEDQALEIAREYLLTHTIAEFEAEPWRLERFAKALRENGIDDAALRRMASTEIYSPRKCGFHSNVYDVYHDEIALQGYNVQFEEYVPTTHSPDVLTIRIVSIRVSYCGSVLRGPLGPLFIHSDKKISRSNLTAKCRSNAVPPTP